MPQITDARLIDGARVDLTIAAGRIAAITPHAGGRGDTHLAGALLLPGLIEGHVHLDKTLMGLPWRPHAAAPNVQGRIEHERENRASLGPVQPRARALLARMIANGTTALRTHTDIDDACGLANFHAVLEVATEFRAILPIEIVAFPQSGIVTRPGVAGLLDAALREGADLVGGLDPATIDGDASGHLDIVFALAARHGKGIDIHLHDRDPGGNAQLRDIAARSHAAGMHGRVTVSHAFSLGTDDADDFSRTADALAHGGVAILTSAPGPIAMPPVKPLRARGVTIFGGNDNIRDLWSPWGNGDMLERAWMIAQRQGFRSDEDLAIAFDVCTAAGARMLGLPEHGIHVGARADFVAVPAETLAEAIAERPPGRQTWINGIKR